MRSGRRAAVKRKHVLTDHRSSKTSPQNIAAPTRKPFRDLHDLWRRSGLSRASLERLANADGFRSLGLDRRQALWELRGLPETKALPLFDYAETAETGQEPPVSLPAMPLSEHVVSDYRALRLSLKEHPMHFFRPRLQAQGLAACADLKRARNGARVSLAGLVLVRQRPGSAQGVVFMTLEDETGIANAVVWPKIFETYRQVVMAARLILIHGRIQRHEDIIHLVANRLEDRSHDLGLLSEGGLEANDLLANADEVRRPDPGSWRPERERPGQDGQGDEQGGDKPRDHHSAYSRPHPRWRPKHPRAERIIPKSRDFH